MVGTTLSLAVGIIGDHGAAAESIVQDRLIQDVLDIDILDLDRKLVP